MIFIGIDPGLGGAVAAVNSRGDVVLLEPTPATANAPREYLEAEMREIVSRIHNGREPFRAAIERAQAMPGQGVRSMFTIGLGFGIWRGILASFGVPYEMPRPQEWRRVVGLPSKAGKGESVALAGRLFPSVATELTGPRGGLKDGLAEALLIAEWCRQRNAVPAEVREMQA